MGSAPADPVQRIPAGILTPAFGEHPELAVHTLHICGKHHALVAVPLRGGGDQPGIFQRAGVDAYLVRAAFQHPVKILQRVDAAAHGQRDKNFSRYSGQDVGKKGASLKAGGDIVKHQLVRPGGVVQPCHLHRVGYVLDALKVRALDHPAIAHVQTGDDAFGYHKDPSFSVLHQLHAAGKVQRAGVQTFAQNRRCRAHLLQFQQLCLGGDAAAGGKGHPGHLGR